jgi:hypothetical protein
MSFIVILNVEFTGSLLTQHAMIGLGAVLKRIYDNSTLNTIDLARTWDWKQNISSQRLKFCDHKLKN